MKMLRPLLRMFTCVISAVHALTAGSFVIRGATNVDSILEEYEVLYYQLCLRENGCSYIKQELIMDDTGSLFDKLYIREKGKDIAAHYFNIDSFYPITEEGRAEMLQQVVGLSEEERVLGRYVPS